MNKNHPVIFSALQIFLVMLQLPSNMPDRSTYLLPFQTLRIDSFNMKQEWKKVKCTVKRIFFSHFLKAIFLILNPDT